MLRHCSLNFHIPITFQFQFPILNPRVPPNLPPYSVLCGLTRWQSFRTYSSNTSSPNFPITKFQKTTGNPSQSKKSPAWPEDNDRPSSPENYAEPKHSPVSFSPDNEDAPQRREYRPPQPKQDEPHKAPKVLSTESLIQERGLADNNGTIHREIDDGSSVSTSTDYHDDLDDMIETLKDAARTTTNTEPDNSTWRVDDFGASSEYCSWGG